MAQHPRMSEGRSLPSGRPAVVDPGPRTQSRQYVVSKELGFRSCRKGGTRQASSLGDALLANGQVKARVQVIRGLKGTDGRLDGQAWYRYWVSGDYRRAANVWRVVVL